jgi:hypothetical protein
MKGLLLNIMFFLSLVTLQVHLPNDGYQDNDLGYSFQIF